MNTVCPSGLGDKLELHYVASLQTAGKKWRIAMRADCDVASLPLNGPDSACTGRAQGMAYASPSTLQVAQMGLELERSESSCSMTAFPGSSESRMRNTLSVSVGA